MIRPIELAKPPKREAAPARVALVTLGCAKNLVDSEIMAGLRIAVTTTVGLATLAFFAGAGGLGERIFDDIIFKSNVVVAGGLAVALAALLDGAILLVQRMITPWTRATAAR